ncbi:Tripartite-type tricarboxylate transporter, receptor component TctC [Tranquillimonas rosea]|uniref:Tripartite-type tricarboxylate transporter, receptor component TctC n=1 Tax=Tranquillimonas rosea TaxID=641238 RepID=A0A1H9WRA2_9RHOB|nr:tripartite tricarboxylate transporter substrate-binding protein [Tranquillimonas rosea]SES36460.1 Tripartite-type tricarboxylate transporter, receptor component TctC [Tranquillimonas rosea]
MHTTLRHLSMAPALVALTIAAPAIAQEAEYNPSSITAFVAAGAGGGTDNFTRTVQPMLEERLDTNITVINLPSASGALAHQRTAQSEPNGEALDFASSTFITSRAAGQNPIGLDQLTPVARMQSDVMTLVVNPEKYETFEEFRAYAEENPGKVVIGGTHAASVDRMAFLALNEATGFDLNFIPYDNEGAASANLLSGNIDGMFNEISAIQGYMESGEMKPVLALADERLEDYPDMPTTVENGWDFTFGNERGVFINAETDPEIIAAIESAFEEVFNSDEYQAYAEKVSLDVRSGWLGSEEYRKVLEENLAFFENLLADE